MNKFKEMQEADENIYVAVHSHHDSYKYILRILLYYNMYYIRQSSFQSKCTKTGHRQKLDNDTYILINYFHLKGHFSHVPVVYV